MKSAGAWYQAPALCFSENVPGPVRRRRFGFAQDIAFGAIQRRFRGLAQFGDFGGVALHKAGLSLVEFAGGRIIAFAHDLLLLFCGFFGGFIPRSNHSYCKNVDICRQNWD